MRSQRANGPSKDVFSCFFFFQAEDGIRDDLVTGVQTCALPIFLQVAQIDYDKGQTEIDRDGLRQTVAVTGRLEGQDLGTGISEIKSLLAKEVKFRSEERRVGKECRYRWSRCDEKKKKGKEM